MLYTEDQIERMVEKVARCYRESDASLKLTAIAAAPIVGSYDGTTELLKEKIGRSTSTIENWADAGKLYLELIQSKVYKKLAHKLWHSLPTSHWWLARSMQKRGYLAIHYLNQAHEHGWSGREMMKEFEADIIAGQAKMQISRAMIVFRELAWELSQYENQLPKNKKAALRAVREAF